MMATSLSRFLLRNSAACFAVAVSTQEECATAVVGRNGKGLANARENFNLTL